MAVQKKAWMGMGFLILILILILLLLLHLDGAKGSPPGAAVTCARGLRNCTLSNAYGMFPDRLPCRAASAVFPNNEKELVEVVARATRSKQKMRVATRWSHSLTRLACPGGGGGEGVIISTLYLNRIVSIDISSMSITVESGASLREVIDAAAARGLALPHSPYWEGLSIAGLLATGAHGSSLFGKGSAVHEYLLSLSLVIPAAQHQNYAKLLVLTEHDQDFRAAKVSLGLLGIISQVTLQLQPMFKRSIFHLQKDDADLDSSVIEFGTRHEFGDVTWYPSQGKVVYRVDDRIPSTSFNDSGDGVYDFIGFWPISAALLTSVRATEEACESWRKREAKCACAKAQLMAMRRSGWGLRSGSGRGRQGAFSGHPVVGFQHMVQASGSCLYSPHDGLTTACPWDPRLRGEFFHQTSVAIHVNKIGDFIKDVQKLEKTRPGSLCGVELYNGILMRFVKASSAYLGAQEDSVEIDITYYRSYDPSTPRLDEDILEEIEQIALFKYGGTPHWGKNRNLAFHAVMDKYPNSKHFLDAKFRYDPDALLSNEWTDGILGIGMTTHSDGDGCALEGLCICREDRHCAPDKGYVCRPGKVFQPARICEYQTRK